MGTHEIGHRPTRDSPLANHEWGDVGERDGSDVAAICCSCRDKPGGSIAWIGGCE